MKTHEVAPVLAGFRNEELVTQGKGRAAVKIGNRTAYEDACREGKSPGKNPGKGSRGGLAMHTGNRGRTVHGRKGTKGFGVLDAFDSTLFGPGKDRVGRDVIGSRMDDKAARGIQTRIVKAFGKGNPQFAQDGISIKNLGGIAAFKDGAGIEEELCEGTHPGPLDTDKVNMAPLEGQAAAVGHGGSIGIAGETDKAGQHVAC